MTNFSFWGELSL